MKFNDVEIDKVEFNGEEVVKVNLNDVTLFSKVATAPSISYRSRSYTSITVDVTNNDSLNCTIYVEESDDTPDKYPVNLAPGASTSVTLTGLNDGTTYTIYARAQPYIGSEVGTLSPYTSCQVTTLSYTKSTPPTIYKVSATTSSITWKCSNPYAGTSLSIINSELGDSTPDLYQDDLFSEYYTPNHTKSSLSSGTSYKVYAKSYRQIGGFTWSDVVNTSITTDGDSSGGGCLHYDTLVTMWDGTRKKVYNLKVGDELLGYKIPGMIDADDPNWREWTTENPIGEKVMCRVKTAVIDFYPEYYFINNDIKITKAHRFFARHENSNIWGWIDSPDLVVGDYLLHEDGSHVKVSSIEFVQDRLDVVTVDVEETDTYFAGGTAVLVHNSEVKY